MKLAEECKGSEFVEEDNMDKFKIGLTRDFLSEKGKLVYKDIGLNLTMLSLNQGILWP